MNDRPQTVVFGYLMKINKDSGINTITSTTIWVTAKSVCGASSRNESDNCGSKLSRNGVNHIEKLQKRNKNKNEFWCKSQEKV
jgi:hypothetical protein